MNEYNRVYALIYTDNIRKNLLNIKNRVGAAAVMPIIKADAYGHGSIPAAKATDDLSECFGVATIEEATELRNAGITKPILILGTLSPEYFGVAVKYDITVNVYTAEMAKKLSCVASQENKPASVHLSVDTGMNRVGLFCDDRGVEEAKKICSYSNLRVEGIFSHFATSDEADKTEALIQAKRFDEFCKKLENEGLHFKYKHLRNSGACCDLFYQGGNLVRPGIILYGLYPSDKVSRELELFPAMELKSHVAYIKRIPSGEGVSYGRTYITDREITVATIPVGYADGYPRLLSGRGRVIINGHYAPIIGRVCMDQFMVDISGIDGVSCDDTVTLIGTDGDCAVTVDEIADICGTINYEIVCGISKRVPRIYK